MVVPEPHNKICLPGQGGVYRILCKKVAELTVICICRGTADYIAGIDIFNRIGKPEGAEF